MLTCKNVVLINIEGAKEPIVAEYDRVYLDHAATDKVEPLEKTNKKAPVMLNGAKWVGTRPVDNLPDDPTQVPNLFQEAINYLMTQWGAAKEYEKIPADVRGIFIMLQCADYGNDLKVRAKLQQENRPSVAASEEKTEEKILKNMVANAAARGKVLTMDKAKVLLAKIRALEEEDEPVSV